MTDASSVTQKVDDFFSQFKARQFDKGQIIIFAGDEPQYVYFLVKGLIRQYDLSYRGDELVVNVFKPGAFFPMSWAVNRTPNMFFYQAAETVEVRLADPDKVVQFIKQNPDVLFDLLSRVYKGTDGILGRMVGLMAGNAKNRLMYEISTQCRRFGEKQSDGNYVIKITETELAARAGLSRETVSREMTKLIKDGALSLDHGDIIVKNL